MVRNISRKAMYIASLITLPTVVGVFMANFITSSNQSNDQKEVSSIFESAYADVPSGGADGGCGAGSCGAGGGSCGGP